MVFQTEQAEEVVLTEFYLRIKIPYINNKISEKRHQEIRHKLLCVQFYYQV